MRNSLLSIFGLVAIVLYSASALADCTNPDGPTGKVILNTNYDVFQGCTASGQWMAFHPPPPASASCTLDGQTVPHGNSYTFYSAEEDVDCASISQSRTCTNGTLDGSGTYQYSSCDPPAGPTGCDNIGDVCSDGSVYAGLSPDGNVPMYTTPADQGGYPWNNGNSSNYVTTNQTSNITGQSNTATLITIDSDSGTGGTQPHQAAQVCADLSAHGHTDWYLPARNELDVLYNNRTAVGGFDTSGSYPAGLYWSSSEGAAFGYARYHNFSDGGLATFEKYHGLSVRCVRR